MRFDALSMERRLHLHTAFEPTRLSVECLQNAYESLLPGVQRPMSRREVRAERPISEPQEQGSIPREKNA
jgi:hypothetical protein